MENLCGPTNAQRTYTCDDDSKEEGPPQTSGASLSNKLGSLFVPQTAPSSIFRSVTPTCANPYGLKPPHFVKPDLLFYKCLNRVIREERETAAQFDGMIVGHPRCQQFIFTQQRWALQLVEAEKMSKECNFMAKHMMLPTPPTRREALRLPIGGYIESRNSGKYYMNLGEAAKTLQGSIYFAVQFHESCIDDALRTGGSSFPLMVSTLSANPDFAIKFYDKASCDKGVSLEGLQVKERAVTEMKLTRNLYVKSLKIRPLFSWLPPPSKNVVRYFDHWETPQNDAYYLVMEYANCGEMMEVIDGLHPLMNSQKTDALDQIEDIDDAELRSIAMIKYRESLSVQAEGTRAYIELIRYLFQQMVQSVSTLHNQGIAHLDVSLENFVAHYDDDGKLLVKLIDFGRAKKAKKKERFNRAKKPGSWPYEGYDFSVSTFPGKIRYSSPEAALFLKYQESAPYDASKEDVYALGVILYVMLTGTMSCDTPFYIKPDEADPETFGYLNGCKERKIDLRTMKDVKSGLLIGKEIIDPVFHLMQSGQGLVDRVMSSCHLDYFTKDALDLLCHIFERRISLKELASHPFVCSFPNPRMVQQVVAEYGVHRKSMKQQSEDRADKQRERMAAMYESRFPLRAVLMMVKERGVKAVAANPNRQNAVVKPNKCADPGIALNFKMMQQPPDVPYELCISPDPGFSPSPEPADYQ